MTDLTGTLNLFLVLMGLMNKHASNAPKNPRRFISEDLDNGVVARSLDVHTVIYFMV